MAADRVITCTNKDGISMKFKENDIAPFLLVKADGIYDHINTVYTSENTMIDGSEYQGTHAKMRNIVLTLKDTGDGEHFAEDRNLLNQLFKSGESGVLKVSEAGMNERIIDYYVEYFKSTGTHTKRLHSISLLCPDPFFYNPVDESVWMATWVPSFEFPFECPEGETFEFGYQSPVRIQNIYNEYAEDNIGLTIKITSSGAFSNPTITRVESNSHITIGTALKPLSVEVGDVLVITTGNGNKHVYLTHEGVTNEINQYLTEDSEFIQLMRGNNHIGYSADSGESYMTVQVSYRLKHARA